MPRHASTGEGHVASPTDTPAQNNATSIGHEDITGGAQDTGTRASDKPSGRMPTGLKEGETKWAGVLHRNRKGPEPCLAVTR